MYLKDAINQSNSQSQQALDLHAFAKIQTHHLNVANSTLAAFLANKFKHDHIYSIKANYMRVNLLTLYLSSCISPLVKAKATLKCPSIRLKVEEVYMSARKGRNIFRFNNIRPYIFTSRSLEVDLLRE